MKINHANIPVLLVGVLLSAATASPCMGADKIWDGGGPDGYWRTDANWVGDVRPSPGDVLFFTGTTRLGATNDFYAGTPFGGITFASPAGAFTLSGNRIALQGNITNAQVVVTQTISLPISLAVNSFIDVVTGGALTINGVISDSGYGLTKTGGGLLTLATNNTFTGPVGVLGGMLSVAADANLGAAPAVPTPGMLKLDGGVLRSTATFTLSSNRGISLGPSTGSGIGTILVSPATTLTYGGVIANNGTGTGGLIKDGFGALTLSGANTYTGPTIIKVGTNTLNFAASGAPVQNIIHPSSALTLGGGNAGAGSASFAMLQINGAPYTTNSQTFSRTTVDIGLSVIRLASGVSNAVNLNLGGLTPTPGGLLTFLPPTAGVVTTTSTNISGILGAWAVMGSGALATNITLATNWACVGPNGSIVNYLDHFVYSSGYLRNLDLGDGNVLVGPTISRVYVDTPGAGTVTDINTLMATRTDTSVWGLEIGAGNTLRLGRWGGIFKVDLTSGNWTIGTITNANGNGVQDEGTLTAGGADDTPGVIVFNVNNASQSTGSLLCEVRIADNGGAPVTVVKAGPGAMKLRGHNTYSGGTHILQGRLQLAGSELDTPNPDGCGTGPIYIYPGSYLFFSGAGQVLTNTIYVAGSGTAGEPLGALRLSTGWQVASTIILMGDTAIGGGGTISGKITGPYSLGIGNPSGINVHGAIILSNPENDWSGTTFINANLRTTGNMYNALVNGTNECIPNGFGKGNVVMSAPGTYNSVAGWNLNGFNETINGLWHSGAAARCLISNNAAGTVSTLTVGDNDQSGIFGGLIADGAGVIALRKIGNGVQTLTGPNTYSGETIVDGGTLALSGAGSISASTRVVVNAGAALDVSGVTAGFTLPGTTEINGGTLIVRNTGSPGVGTLVMNNARLRAITVGSEPNVVTANLITGGQTNLIDLVSIGTVSSYPATFPIINYQGSIGGAGFNFGLGSVPAPSVTGYVSNDTANAQVVLVLLTGPKPLTWSGAVNGDWDIGTTTNWLAFGTTPEVYYDLDPVRFDDSAAITTVNVRCNVIPGNIVVANNTKDYVFTGDGGIGGLAELRKEGAATLTIANNGINTYSGGTVISGGTLQVGNGGTSGNLPVTGMVVNEGALVFNRADDVEVNGPIMGTGTITKQGGGVLTLGGANTYEGETVVVAGTLRAASGSALGSPVGSTLIQSGATLDVNGQNLGAEPLIVSGSGVGGLGAIINTGAGQINALQNVTLAGHTTFGGTGRWDIRGVLSQLSTGGNAYNLTKVGPNQISLVATTVDPALANVWVQEGIFSIETTTTGLGNPASTLTIAQGATLQLYNLQNALDKIIVLNGDGSTTTLNCGAGVGNAVNGSVTLNGTCIVNTAAGTILSWNGTVGGTGSLIKTGGGTNVFTGTVSYSGTTLVNGGALIVDGNKTGTGAVTVNAGVLGGYGTIAGPVSVGQNCVLSPGGIWAQEGTLTINNNLTLSDSTCVFQVSPYTADAVQVSGNLTLNGTNTLQIVPTPFLEVGAVYTLFTYSGTLAGGAGNIRIVAPSAYTFTLIDPALTPGVIQVRVDKAPVNLTWKGGAPGAPSTWDIETTPNWDKGGTITVFRNGDFATFDDSSSWNQINLVGTIEIGNATFNNSVRSYTLTGTGSLTGAGGLEVNGWGEVTIANSGSNTFAGPITIYGQLLRVGNGGTDGNLGTGPVTNYGNLIFNRSGELYVPNAIHGTGTVTKEGPGVVTLAGSSTFWGDVFVNAGTLRTLNSAALGSTLGGTYIAEGATLDIGTNTVNLGLEPITVSGAGVNGQGAIINSSGNPAYVGPNVRLVTLVGDTTFGGTGRWDLRSDPATAANAWLLTGGQPFKLTKVGTNLVSLVGVQTDPALAEIEVREGTLGVERLTTLGDETKTLTIYSNAMLQFYQVSNVLGKPIVMLDGALVNNASGTNIYGGTVALMGSNTFIAGGTWLRFTNVLSGPGSLTKMGGATLVLEAQNTYRGSTFVNGGVLALAGSGSIWNSTNITLNAGTVLDVTERVDGTLTLVSGQMLQGAGRIDGNLAVNPGSLLLPGTPATPIGTLTVTNSIVLQGTTVMELNKGVPQRNDQLVATNIVLGGSLIVTNAGSTLHGGDTFRLFAGALNGAFAQVSLPQLWPGLTWDISSLAVDGTITVVGTMIPPAISGRVIGGAFVLSGSGGMPGAPYYVLSSTNVATPLAQWTVVAEGVFDDTGKFTANLPMTPGEPQRFYLLQIP